MNRKDNEIMDLQKRIASLEDRLNRHSHSGVGRDGVRLTADNLKNLSTSGNFYAHIDQISDSNGTGLYSITGVGFKPKMVRIEAYISGNDSGPSSLGGYIDGFTGFGGVSHDGGCVYKYFDTSTTSLYCNRIEGNIIRLDDDAGNEVTASLDSLDDDGFTLDFSTFDETFEIMYYCYA